MILGSHPLDAEVLTTRPSTRSGRRWEEGGEGGAESSAVRWPGDGEGRGGGGGVIVGWRNATSWSVSMSAKKGKGTSAIFSPKIMYVTWFLIGWADLKFL